MNTQQEYEKLVEESENIQKMWVMQLPKSCRAK